MINVIIGGICGKIGSLLYQKRDPEFNVVCGVDKALNGDFDCPVYSSFYDVDLYSDVVVDFSSPTALDGILDYALKNSTTLVLATTGYSDEQVNAIKEASLTIPILLCPNVAESLSKFSKIVRLAAESFSDYDVEIIEKHRAQKADAPSGTAIKIAREIKDAQGEDINFEDQINRLRSKREIRVHSIRGGGLFGEHEVLFMGSDDVISLKHVALSKNLFVEGAKKAAKFITKQTSGLYRKYE